MSTFLPALTRDVIALEAGSVEPEIADRATAWVTSRFAGAGDVTALGLRVTGLLLAIAVSVTTGRRYAGLPDERRVRVARRLLDSRLPLVGEYVKAVRALALTYVYEARFATAP